MRILIYNVHVSLSVHREGDASLAVTDPLC